MQTNEKYEIAAQKQQRKNELFVLNQQLRNAINFLMILFESDNTYLFVFINTGN